MRRGDANGHKVRIEGGKAAYVETIPTFCKENLNTYLQVVEDATEVIFS
jgi:hypothetical protein